MALNKVEICGVNTARLPILTNEEKDALFIQIRQGDAEAREQFIKGNLRLVLSVIRRFSSAGENVDDLFQIGCIGLIKAIDHFNTELGVRFSTYAVPMIIGEIRRFLRDDGMVKVSRTLKENGYKIRRAGEMLTRELGREPTMEELAEAAGLEHEEIVLALEANREVASIYQPVYERDGEELLLIDQMEGSGGQSAEREEPEKEAVLNHILVEQLLETVGERERRLLQLRYYEGKTQCEVAELLSMSQVQVSRLEKKLLLQLRERVRM